MAKIAQIIIGDELLSGKIQDLNLKWLADFLLPTGYKLNSSEIIGDSEEQIITTITNTLKNNDAILITGGLGPTKDDKTKAVLGQFLNSKLVENEKSIELVSEHYKRFDKEWSRENNHYHMIPEGVTPLSNPRGLAPGLMAEIDGKYIFCAPGVPREFQGMTEEVIFPILEEKLPSQATQLEIFNIRTFGIPEEKIFHEICPGLWEELEQFGSVSSLPQIMNVDITLRLERDAQLESKKEQIIEIMKNTPIWDSVWQIGTTALPEYIIQKAKEKNLTISFAESCTGGLTASNITDISGSSSVFLGSVVCYANEVKTGVLGVKEQTLIDHGAVSAQTAYEMAEGARKVMNSDISISFTGIAGPGGGTPDKPVGTVGIGWSTKDGTESKIYNFRGDRLKLKERFMTKGLFKLLQLINTY
jgi:nicotinamide-nucleotide amidase